MKVFVAGASGAIGRPLMEQLTRDGHEVTGMIRRAEGADRLRRLRVEPVQVDAFDRNAVRAALERTENRYRHRRAHLLAEESGRPRQGTSR
jgi:2-alkyl-3-oxoalkanoate reductase